MTILEENGYLGKHSPKLKVGDTESMVFKPHNIGPWYLSDKQREGTKARPINSRAEQTY
jgi:hypothetical protein